MGGVGVNIFNSCTHILAHMHGSSYDCVRAWEGPTGAGGHLAGCPSMVRNLWG